MAEESYGLTKEELIEAHIIANPDLWAETHLRSPMDPDKPLKLRSYQRKIIRDRHQRKLLRMGRRCVYKDDIIYTTAGPITVEELFHRQDEVGIFTLDTDTFKIYITHNYEVWYNDRVPTIQITTKSGKVQRVSVDHPFLIYTENGPEWIEARSIKVGQRVAVPRSISMNNAGGSITPDEARFIGYLAGGGALTTDTNSGIRITIDHEDVLEDFSQLYDRLRLKYSSYSPTSEKNISFTLPVEVIIDRAGLTGKDNYIKRIPETIFTGSDEVVREFLAGYWMAGWRIKEGSKPVRYSAQVRIASVNRKLIEGVRFLLYRLGIHSTLRKSSASYKRGFRCTIWKLEINDNQSLRRFREVIPLTGYKKQQLDQLNLDNDKPGKTWLTQAPREAAIHLRKVLKRLGISQRAVLGRYKRLRSTAQPVDKVLAAAKAAQSEEDLAALSSDVLWEPVTRVEYFEDPADTYDLHVLRTQCFIGNGIIQHNTGKSVLLAIEALWKAFTHANRQVLLTAAYETQIDNLFDLIRRMSFDSPEIKESISGFRKKPYELWFKNGSVIRGLVANASIRGKCLIAGTMVWMANGDWKPIEKIRPGDEVITLHPQKLTPQKGKVINFYENGVKPVYELRTTSARRLIATGNHPLYVFTKGWTPVSEIKTKEEYGRDSNFIAVVDAIGQLNWARVNSIHPVGKMPTYDIEVEDYHHFIAFYPTNVEESGFSVSGLSNGGILVHNSADDLIIDEGDYIPQDVLLADIWPIATTYKHTTVIFSSTPSGRREFFWKVSVNKHKPEFNFHEYHIPSSMSPEWTPEQEALVLAITTRTKYEHEYCLVGETEILTGRGSVPIKDISIGDTVYSDGKDYTVIDFRYTGQKPCLTLFTDAGKVTSSIDHSFNTRNGKEQAQFAKEINIQIKDRLLNQSTDVLRAAIIGFLYGDGYVSSTCKTVTFYSNDYADLERLRRIIDLSFPNDYASRIIEKEPGFYSLQYGQSLYEALISLGVPVGNRVTQLTNIPAFIVDSTSQEVKAAFLSALLSTDGNTIKGPEGTISISFTKKSLELALHYYNQLAGLISAIGFQSSLSCKTTRNGNLSCLIYITNGSWVNFLIDFYDKVGYNLCERKEREALVSYLYACKYKRLLADKELVEKANRGIIPQRLYQEIESYKEFRERHLNPRGVYAEIYRKEEVGLRDTYNLTVTSPDHSYVLANQMLTYNCAEFGEAAEGVFRHKDIDASLYVYDYSDLKYNPNNYYTLGVDWNESKNGVQIVMVEFLNEPAEVIPYNQGDWDPKNSIVVQKKFRLFGVWEIDAVEYTNTKAVDEVIEVLKRFPPNYALFDHGHGHTNWELLRLALMRGETSTGKKCPGLKHLLERMDVVDFGSRVETIDPYTQTTLKHKAKNFIVKLTTAVLENGMIMIPAVNEKGVPLEDNEKALVPQMRDYNIARYGQQGEVYEAGPSGDHRLDAFMLAIYAYGKEHDQFLRYNFDLQPQLAHDTLTPAVANNRILTPADEAPVGFYRTKEGILVRDYGNWVRPGEPPDDFDEKPTGGLLPTFRHARRSSRFSKKGSRSL